MHQFLACILGWNHHYVYIWSKTPPTIGLFNFLRWLNHLFPYIRGPIIHNRRFLLSFDIQLPIGTIATIMFLSISSVFAPISSLHVLTLRQSFFSLHLMSGNPYHCANHFSPYSWCGATPIIAPIIFLLTVDVGQSLSLRQLFFYWHPKL